MLPTERSTTKTGESRDEGLEIGRREDFEGEDPGVVDAPASDASSPMMPFFSAEGRLLNSSDSKSTSLISSTDPQRERTLGMLSSGTIYEFVPSLNG